MSTLGWLDLAIALLMALGAGRDLGRRGPGWEVHLMLRVVVLLSLARLHQVYPL